MEQFLKVVQTKQPKKLNKYFLKKEYVNGCMKFLEEIKFPHFKNCSHHDTAEDMWKENGTIFS